MKRSTQHITVVLVLVALAGCGREATPTSPSTPRSFLEGVWTGTLTVEREGEPRVEVVVLERPLLGRVGAVPFAVDRHADVRSARDP